MSLRIVYDEAIPSGVVYLMPEPTEVSVGPIMFRRDPWGPAPYRLDPDYAEQRDLALDHLADLLDEMCESFGMDPEEVWREPRWWEQARHDQMRFMAHERVALSVLKPDWGVIVP